MSLAPHDKTMVDAHTGVSTTGHEWDGIRELNTPLPRWWLWMLYATIVWAFGYMIVYPAVPLLSGHTAGLFGWSSRGAVTQELAALGAQRAPMVTALASATLPDIEKNPTLLAFARAQGKAAFGDNCAGCHGAGGGGARGFPNLVDDEWIWGGTLDDILQTITYGIRSTDAKTRVGNMPAFGADGVLKPAEIAVLADYVRSLSGLPVDGKPDLAAGAKLFEENCAACHGPEGKGVQDVGAPNLTDQIWLYGADKASIVEGLNKGRGAVMPQWGDRLDAGTIKALAVYVHTLGGGR